MVFFPNCKINLGLKILRKRDDGFHDLETTFYPLPLKDVLEIVRSTNLQFIPTGIPIPGLPDGNLCLKAFHLLKNDFPDLPLVHIYLYKNIPIGAGLGGGSSDGAFMLAGLNRQFRLGLGDEQLRDYAIRLGSDCPFFLLNTPCFGSGRGEQLDPISLDLSGYSFVLIHPRVHISTAQAFASCQPDAGGKPIREIIHQPLETWRQELVNDFEEPIFHQYPSLRIIKEQLYNRGAHYAAMTGSGSSFFGLFEKNKAPSSGWDPAYQVIVLP